MTLIRETIERWQRRREEWARLGVQVDGAKIADELLVDLDQIERYAEAESVSLSEASLIGGYSVDYLQRLVAAGTIRNVGRKHRPRILRSDVPMKPGHSALRGEPSTPTISPSAVVTSAIQRSSA